MRILKIKIKKSDNAKENWFVRVELNEDDETLFANMMYVDKLIFE